MVVSVLIITCFLKLATCHPYVSSISSTKLPATTHEATNVSPRDINVGRDLRPKYSYGYMPQGTAKPVEDNKPSNVNERPMGITPHNIMPKQNMPDKVIPDNYINFNEATPIMSGPKTVDLDDRPEISKNPNEVSTPKYQHIPFSKTFNNFRENLLKTMDLDLRSKSLTTRPLKNIQTNDVAPINQEAKFVEPQIKTLTTQPIQLTDNLPQVVPNNNYNNMFSGPQNERTKVEVLLPDDAGEFKDYTFDAENISANRVQVSRVPYSNSNPFFQISKENKLGKLNPKAQQQDVKYNTPNMQQQTKMQPLKIPPYKPQENSSYLNTIVPTNQNLLPPYNEERNLTQTLRIPNQNQVSPIDSEALYFQLISDNETIRENQLKTDPRTLQVPISRMAYYQNSKSLFQPSQNNQSLQENPIVTMDSSSLLKLNVHNTSPYSIPDKIIPLAQRNFTNLNLEENISEVSNPGIILKPSTKEENISYQVRAPYYNNIYQPYTRAYGQQLLPRNHSSPLNQLEKVDLQHYSEKGNVVQKAYIATNPQDISSVVAIPETIITTGDTSNNVDENILQNFAPPYYNIYRPYSRSFDQQIKPENQSLKHEDNARTPSMNNPVDRNVPKKSHTLPTNPEIIPSGNPEFIYQPENLHNSTENVSKTLKTTSPYNNEFYQPFLKAYSQQFMPRNHSPKLNQQEKMEPQNSSKERNVPQITANFQKNNSVLAYPETIFGREQTLNNVNESVSLNSPPPYYNRPYSTAFNQQLKFGNQSLRYEEQTRKADPMLIFSERNVPQPTNNVIPNSRIIPSVTPEIISQPEQNLQNEEKIESQILKTPYYNKFNQPFSRAFGSQLQSSDQLSKENQFSNAISNNGAEKNESPAELYQIMHENTLDPSPKTSNISSAQILQENHILIKTDQISFPELDVLQMSIPLQRSLPQVPISEVSQGAPLPIKEERNEFQVFKEAYDKNLDPFNSIITINPQLTSSNKSSTENLLLKVEPDINVKHNIIPYNMVIDESVSQMQPLSEFSSPIQQNLIESPEDKSLLILPTVNNDNLLDSIIEEALPPTEPSSQLPFHTQENLPEFIQQIDVSENMRTKNAIATPAYNLGAKTKGTQPSHNGKLLENRDHTSRMSYFDRLNLPNSRGSIQQAAPYNQILNENKQIPKPNQNILSQSTNNYNMPNNEFSNKNEAQASLLLPQQHNKKSLPIKYTHSGNPEDEKMDNKVIKSYNSGIPGYDLQNTRVPYYNNFDPFISNTINQQTLHSSQRVKSKPTESLNQDLHTKENVNNTLHNDKGTESDSEILKINIPLQFQEKPQDPPTYDVFDNQGNAKVKKEKIQNSDTPEPTTQYCAFSQDITRFENESQANGKPFNNNPQPYESNELNQQLSYDNQMKNEDTSSKLTIINQNTMPKLDININISNSEDVCKNIPLAITITEKPNKACAEKINDNIAQNIIIDINNENENSCKCLNVNQKCDEITSIGNFIPCLTEESNVIKESNCTKTTVESSQLKEIVPSIDLDDFSSYLADTILSAVQSFLVQPNCSSLNSIVAKNNFDIVRNSLCNCSQIEIPLQNIILEAINNTNESAVPLLNVKEESNHSTIKYQCPGTWQKDEVKTDTVLKGTHCLEPNLALQEEQSNKTSEIHPALNKTIINTVTAIQYNKTEPDEMTKDSCICTHKTLQIPPHIDNNSHSDTSNPDGKVLETDGKTHILCTSTNKTRQVVQNVHENSSNANTNDIMTSHQSPQVLLPYYYYVDHKNVTSSDTESVPKPSQPVNTSEEEGIVVTCLENDTETIPTVIYDKPEEVERTYYGPKPCLSKITVNIMPIVDKSNHDILVFI